MILWLFRPVWCHSSINMMLGLIRCRSRIIWSRVTRFHSYLVIKWNVGWRTCEAAVLFQLSTSLGNSGLCWTVFARNRDTAVPAEGNGDLQTLICVLVARPRRCLTLLNPVPWRNWMAAYLGYTLRMRTLFRGWPIMVNDTHTRRRSECEGEWFWEVEVLFRWIREWPKIDFFFCLWPWQTDPVWFCLVS